MTHLRGLCPQPKASRPAAAPAPPRRAKTRAGRGSSARLIRLRFYSAAAALAVLTTGSARRSSAAPADGKWTLPRCIQTALAHNPTLQAAHWAARRAAERTREAKGYRLPFLSVEGTYDRWDRDQRIHMPHEARMTPSDFDKDIFGYSLAARLPLFRGGRIVNGIRLADAQREIAAQGRVRAQEAVVFNVTSAFYRAAALTKVLGSTRASLKAMESHENVVAHQVQVGRSARVDLLRVRVRVADLKQLAVQVESDRDVALHLLSTLMGVDETLPSDALSYELRFEPKPLHVEQWIGLALANRPDYLAAQKAIDAAKRRTAIAKSEHWPSLDLRGGYAGRSAADHGKVDENWNLGLELRLPLYAGGTIQSRVAQARLAEREARANARKIELAVRHEVQTACLHIRKAAERVRATEAAVAEAKESLRIEREKYRTGKATITDVLDAQAAWLRSETNYFESLAQHRIAWAELALAMGRKPAEAEKK